VCLIQTLRRMGWITLSLVGRVVVPYVPNYLINGKIFAQKYLLNTKCVSSSLKILSKILLTLRRTQRDSVLNLPHVKQPLWFSDCNETWILSNSFSKKIRKCQISWNSFQWKSSPFHAKYHDTNSYKPFNNQPFNYPA